jgi:hypothetical protein
MRGGFFPAFTSDPDGAWAARSRGATILRLGLAGGAVFVLATAGIWAALSLSFHRSKPLDSPSVDGVRLGMTSESARASFIDGALGRWASVQSCCGEGLEWTRGAQEGSAIRWAHFDFQQGRLVALHLAEDATGPHRGRRVEVSAGSVLEVRAGADGSVKTTLLALASTNHRAEVSEILASQGADR